MLDGRASWDDVDDALDAHADFLRRFTAEQDVQTNEVQRAWALLPAFLWLYDGRPLDLVELGPSAGLNLVWDRYGYRYSSGTWGDGALELSGDDRVAPPADLLRRRVSVARRRGIDLNPVDATSDDGARLLKSFVWADQDERRDRLRRAIEIMRADPPELVRGDYVDALGPLLADRREGAQLVVFQTASTMYLERGGLDRVREALEAAGPLVFLNAASVDGEEGFSLQVESYPGGESAPLLVFDFHGGWLEWRR